MVNSYVPSPRHVPAFNLVTVLQQLSYINTPASNSRECLLEPIRILLAYYTSKCSAHDVLVFENIDKVFIWLVQGYEADFFRGCQTTSLPYAKVNTRSLSRVFSTTAPGPAALLQVVPIKSLQHRKRRCMTAHHFRDAIATTLGIFVL